MSSVRRIAFLALVLLPSLLLNAQLPTILRGAGHREAPQEELSAEATADPAAASPSALELLSQWLETKATAAMGEAGHVTFLGIAAWRYAALCAGIVLTYIVAHAGGFALRRLAAGAKRTRTTLDDMLVEVAFRPARLVLIGLGLTLATQPVTAGIFDGGLQRILTRLFLAIAAAGVVWYAYAACEVLDRFLTKRAQKTEGELDDTVVHVIRRTAQTLIVAIGALVVGQAVLDLNLTALLASAGVIGLAVAFAAQDSIANVFGTIMLVLDRPFNEGERILFQGTDGVVEGLGLRSTRIRTLEGHAVSIPNKVMANEKIENIGKRPHIRRILNIGVPYDTSSEKMEEALEILRDILREHEGMDPDFPPRVHFNDFASSSLNILVIAWFHPAGYWDYLAWCERVNLEVMRRFEAAGIEFAFPTSTTYLAGDNRRPLTVTTCPLPVPSPECSRSSHRCGAGGVA